MYPDDMIGLVDFVLGDESPHRQRIDKEEKIRLFEEAKQ